MLGEIFTRYDLLSMVLIGLGAGLCVAFSNLESTDPTYDVGLLTSDVNFYIVTCQALYIVAELFHVYFHYPLLLMEHSLLQQVSITCLTYLAS
jgi:hypothetical protein